MGMRPSYTLPNAACEADSSVDGPAAEGSAGRGAVCPDSLVTELTRRHSGPPGILTDEEGRGGAAEADWEVGDEGGDAAKSSSGVCRE